MLVFIKINNGKVSGIGISDQTKTYISDKYPSDFSGWGVFGSIYDLVGFGYGKAKRVTTGTNQDHEMQSILAFCVTQRLRT